MTKGNSNMLSLFQSWEGWPLRDEPRGASPRGWEESEAVKVPSLYFLIWRSSPAAWPPAALEPHLRPLWQSPRKDSSSRCRFPWGGIWIGSPFENLSSTGTFYQVLRPGCHTLMMIMISGHDGSQHPAPPSHQLARHQALLTDPQVADVFHILIIMIILQFGLSSSCDSPW